jgi:hypothetical protein
LEAESEFMRRDEVPFAIVWDTNMFWIDLAWKNIGEICAPFRDASNYLVLAHILYTIAANPLQLTFSPRSRRLTATGGSLASKQDVAVVKIGFSG